MIRLSGITVSYAGSPPVTALEQLNVHIGAGVTLFTGPSGAGKSTLLRLLATLVLPDAGQVHFPWGRLAAASQPDTLGEIRGHIGYLPQQKRLTAGLSCAAALEYLTRLRGRGDQPAPRLLARWDLEDVAGKPLPSLSTGQARRWLLAQSQIAQIGLPQVWLLDEPLAGLDSQGQLQLRRQLAAYRRSHSDPPRCAVVASHDTTLADIASSCIRLQDGGLRPA